MLNFGQEIKAARLKKGWRLQDVAQRVGTFKGYVCGIETCTINPPSERMTRKFVRVLGLDIDRMLALIVLQKRKAASLEAIVNVAQEMIAAAQTEKVAS